MRDLLTGSLLVLFFTQASAQISWIPLGPGGGSDLKSVAIQPDNPNVVYCGGDIEGIFKSTDGGATWKNINNNLASEAYTADVYWVQEIIIDPQDFQKIYICTTLGFFKSANGGNSWMRLLPATMNSNDDYLLTSTAAIDPTNTQVIFLGTGGQFSNERGKGLLWRSTDGGSTWSTIDIGMSDSAVVHAIFIDPTSQAGNRTVIVSSNEGIWRSTNNGVAWLPSNFGLPHRRCRRLKGAVQNSNVMLYLTVSPEGDPTDEATYKGGVFRSTDKGSTWVDVTSNLPKRDANLDGFHEYWKITIHPTDANTVLVGTNRGSAFDRGGIYKTTDAGSAWTKIDTAITYGWIDSAFYREENVFLLEYAPGDPNVVYAGLVYMMKSTDGGRTWFHTYASKLAGGGWQGNGLELMNTDGIGFDPKDPNLIYVAYDDFGFFRSTDGGISFRPLDPTQSYYGEYDGAKDILIDPASRDVYGSRFDGSMGGFTAGYPVGKVYMSTDQGSTWLERSSGLPDSRSDLALDTVSGTPGNRTLYCAVIHHGVFKSTNSGQTWFRINSGLGEDSVNVWDVAIHPSDPNVLYMGTNSIGKNAGALFTSTNGGAAWQQIISFPANDIMSIKLNPLNGNIYACVTDDFGWSLSGGLYVSTNAGGTWYKLFSQPRMADIDFDPVDPGRFYTISQQWYRYLPTQENGVFQTTDAGQSWVNISTNLSHSFVNFVRVNPHNSRELFVGTGGGGLFRGLLGAPTGIKEVSLPMQFELHQNYPNPFNPETQIEFHIAHFGSVRMSVADVLGRQVAVLVDEEKPAGAYSVSWNAAAFSSGIYFCRLVAGSYKQTMKIVLIR